MTELSALNVRITGDASDLRAEMSRASGELQKVGAQAQVAQARAGGMAGSLGRLGNVSNRTRAQIQNTSFQLQDIAVQLQGGTRASTVFAQQLPQLLGGFGALGAVAGVLAGVGIPALAFAFASLGSSAQTVEDRMDELKTISQGLKTAQDILALSVDELYEKYGAYGEQLRFAAERLAMLQQAEARVNLSKAIVEMDAVFKQFTTTANSAFRSGTTLAQAMTNIQTEFGLTSNQAREFSELLTDLENATGVDQQATALHAVQEFLVKNNVELAKIPPELRAGLIEANNMLIVMGELANEAGRAADNVARMNTGVPLFEQGHDSLLPPSPMPEDPGTGGGRRGGAARVNPIIAELESLQQGLMTQEELQMQSYMRQQETLQSALDQRLLTQQEYSDLFEKSQLQHVTAMNNLDRQRQKFALDGYQGMFGDLASLMNTNNKKLFKIGQMAAIAEAVVSGYSAAVSAWEKGMKIGGPPVAAAFTAASLAKTGALIAGIKSQSFGGGGGATSAASAGGGAASAATASAADPQQNVQTLNFSVTNDPFGISDRVVRQIVGAINESQRNGSNLIRATVT